MKLITFQTLKAYNKLQKDCYLIVEPKYVNIKKYGVPYNWIVNKMKHINNPYNAIYPIWSWYSYGKIAHPRKNTLLPFFGEDDVIVKITFTKDNKDVLLTDFIKYSFMLTNQYLPKSKEDHLNFNRLMQKYNISNEDLLKYVRQDKYDSYRNDDEFQQINNMISKSYDDILNVESNIIQGTVWDIKKEDIISVEFINKEDCKKRKNVIDYRKNYINKLKKEKRD
jgi:hypothetical protein